VFKRRSKETEPRGYELPPPTQDHLHVRGAMSPGILVADDGTLSTAAIVEPVDLSLTDMAGRQQYYELFARFLAGLPHTCPVQIVVGSLPQRCEAYRDRVKARVERYLALAEEDEALADQARQARLLHMADVAQAHLSFFEAVLDLERPRKEVYLVVVWHNPFPVATKRRELSTSKLEEASKELDRKLAQVMGGLSRMGLVARRATQDDLVDVVHAFYHMTISPLARLQRPSVLASTVLGEADLTPLGGAIRVREDPPKDDGRSRSWRGERVREFVPPTRREDVEPKEEDDA
jgi:hypothetical protein